MDVSKIEKYYGKGPVEVSVKANEYSLIYPSLDSSIGGTYYWGDAEWFFNSEYQWVKPTTSSTFNFPRDTASTYNAGYIKFDGLTELPELIASGGETFTTGSSKDYILITGYDNDASTGNNLTGVTLLGENTYPRIYQLEQNTTYTLKNFSGSFSKANLVYAFPSGSTKSILRYYNGSGFVNTTASYYNGSSFVDCEAYYYDGTEFKKV